MGALTEMYESAKLTKLDVQNSLVRYFYISLVYQYLCSVYKFFEKNHKGLNNNPK